MKCEVCRKGRMQPAIVTLHKVGGRGSYSVSVPGYRCDACGDEEVSLGVVAGIVEPWRRTIDAEEARDSA